MYREGKWIHRYDTGDLVHYREHERKIGESFSADEREALIDVRIPQGYIHGMVEALRENGLIKPIFSNEARAEDLKITHRLIDLLEKSVK
jgi:hypothetical protein